MKRWKVAITASALLLAGCGSSSGKPGDASARQACEKLGTLETDAHAGVVTPAELSRRARSIYDTAKFSTYQPVKVAATALASATSAGANDAAGATAVSVLDAACSKVL